ncbi:MAG: energy transducer TonB [Muribaculaceae bacterium]|nr:energy transducer TonB [Muribaculaceae bacterium]
MKHLILLVQLIVLLSCCNTQTLSNTSNERIIHGDTYDITSGEGLNGTFVYNLTQGFMTVADSIGRFILKVNDGDSIRFKFVGMKNSVILISKETPSNLQVGLDTANTTLIGNEIVPTFYYFNEEWIPGANTNMICKDSISNIEFKVDKYGNTAIFVSLPPNLIDTLKTRVNEAYKGIWVHYDPSCEFPGGNDKLKEWLKENIRIPEGFKGRERVVVGFTVLPDGIVTEGHIIKPKGDERLNKEALRLVQALPRFYVEYYTPVREPIHRALPIVFEKDVSVKGCSATHYVNGWYPVPDFPENKIEGEAFVTTKDFAEVSLDTVSVPDMAVIEGRLKAEMIQKWAEATESRIGKRIGFVFNDSVIMAPTINCRIESGSFTINSPDKALMLEIYNSLKEK